MKKLTQFIFGIGWLIGALGTQGVMAQQGPSSYSAVTSVATSTVHSSISGFGTTTFPSASSFTVRYGEAASATAGVNRSIDQLVLGGQSYVRLPKANGPFDQVTIKRRPNPVVVDLNRTALFFESPTAAASTTVVSANESLFLSPNLATSYESVLNSYTINRGAENIFTNTNVATGTSNVERVDLILSKGFTVKNAATEGILLMERGGDDTFKYAVITGLDVFGNVSSLGPLQSFTNTSNWSNTGINFKSTVLQRNTNDAFQRPSGNVAAEEVKGTFLSMQNLGVGVGNTMFGIVLFHSDVTAGMDLIGLTDVPVNSGSSLDLVGGSGLFSVPSVVNNICPLLTANLTGAFSSTNLPSGTTLTWHSSFPISNATRVANPAAVSGGLFYPAFYDSNLDCYSDPGNAVRVVIVNCPPTAIDDQTETFAGLPVNINVQQNDTDPEGLPFNNPTILTNPTNGTVQVQANGTILYTPAPGFTGTNSFQYIVCDQGTPSLCDTATVTVMIRNAVLLANPDVSTLPINGNIGGVSELGIFINDVLNNQPINSLQVILTSTPSGPLSMNANGVISVAPNTMTGDYSMIYQICETSNPTNCDTARVTVRVVAPPIARNDAALTLVNTPVSGQVTLNDFDLDRTDLLTTTILSNPSNGTLVLAPNGTYTYTPSLSFTGSDTFCYVLSDGTSTDSACVSVNVQPLPGRENNPPVASNDIVETYRNLPVSVSILANDFDPDGSLGSTPTLLIPAQNGTGTIQPNGQLVYTPVNGFVGTDSLQYRICDTGTPVLCDTAWVFVYVQPSRVGNLPPVALEDFNTTVEATPVSGSAALNDYDLDGGILTFQRVSNPTHGLVTFQSDGSFVYTPASGFTGVDSFKYTVCDPTLCDTAVVYITVTPSIKVRLFPRVYLQGALYGVMLPNILMKDQLRVLNIIPSVSPYAHLSPVSATGTLVSGVLGVTGENAIVDWVFVELRDSQDSTIVVDSRAGLLQRDGDIVDVDGVSPLDFRTAISTKSYFVSVRHRNHLGIMSKTALPMTFAGRVVDFRQVATPTFTLTSQVANQAQVIVNQGVAMWAGNGLVDSKIIYQGNNNDVNSIYQKVISSPLNVFSTPFFKVRGYFSEDIDLNGEVIVQGTLNDIEYIYQNVIKNHPGNVFRVPFFVITEQLP